MIFFRRWPQQFTEDRSQRVGPYLIPFHIQMQSVPIRHTVEQLAVFVSQLVVDVQVPNLCPVGELCDVIVDAVDDGHHDCIKRPICFLDVSGYDKSCRVF